MRPSRLALLTIVALLAGPASAQPQDHAVVRRDDLVWGPAPEGLPAGAQVAVIVGDPFVDGDPFTLRVRMPRGYTIPPHEHPTAETLTLIRGRLLVGTDDALDPAVSDLLGPGDVMIVPAEHVHWVMALTDGVEVQVDSVGPLEITYVDPADDPR